MDFVVVLGRICLGIHFKALDSRGKPKTLIALSNDKNSCRIIEPAVL